MKNENFLISQIISNKKNRKIIVSDNKKKITWADLYKISCLNYYNIKKNNSKIIPIICDRRVKTFVSIISIIMAGKTFCPISEKLPVLRIKYVTKKIGSNFLINNSNSKINGIKNYRLKMDGKLDINEWDINFLENALSTSQAFA